MQAEQLMTGPVMPHDFNVLTSNFLSQTQVAVIWPGYGSVVQHLTGMCESLGPIPSSTLKTSQNQ